MRMIFPVRQPQLPSCPITDGEMVTSDTKVYPEQIPSYQGEGNGLVLYIKAASDGSSVGDCPFAQYVRMVLEEKGLTYTACPVVHESKPDWLLDYYGGKMPALQIGNKCYVESEVIAEYVEYSFPEPPLHVDMKRMDEATAAVSGLFPAIARYLKHTPDNDSEDEELKLNLKAVLATIDKHLQHVGGPFLTGESITLLDCSMVPKLYHLATGLEAFKANSIDFKSYPSLQAYVEMMFSRESFRKTACGKDVIVWGWGNARS